MGCTREGRSTSKLLEVRHLNSCQVLCAQSEIIWISLFVCTRIASALRELIWLPLERLQSFQTMTLRWWKCWCYTGLIFVYALLRVHLIATEVFTSHGARSTWNSGVLSKQFCSTWFAIVGVLLWLIVVIFGLNEVQFHICPSTLWAHSYKTDLLYLHAHLWWLRAWNRNHRHANRIAWRIHNLQGWEMSALLLKVTCDSRWTATVVRTLRFSRLRPWRIEKLFWVYFRNWKKMSWIVTPWHRRGETEERKTQAMSDVK